MRCQQIMMIEKRYLIYCINVKKIGYSGVTSIEYDALNVVRDYIKTFYDKDLKSSGSEDK